MSDIVKTPEGVEVKVGQVWFCTDKRRPKTIVVARAGYGQVFYNKFSLLGLSAKNMTLKGHWKLVQDVPHKSSCGGVGKWGVLVSEQKQNVAQVSREGSL